MLSWQELYRQFLNCGSEPCIPLRVAQHHGIVLGVEIKEKALRRFHHSGGRGRRGGREAGAGSVTPERGGEARGAERPRLPTASTEWRLGWKLEYSTQRKEIGALFSGFATVRP